MAVETEYDVLAGAAGSVRGTTLIQSLALAADSGDTIERIEADGGPDLPTGWRTTSGTSLDGPTVLP